MKTLMLNQKTGMLYDDIETYVTKTKSYQNKFVIFPTDIYVKDFVENGFKVGVQNIAVDDTKNQTGEITSEQAYSIGAKYTIIGHSERRRNQMESEEILAKKINTAINQNMKIVYCIGENLVDYKLKETENVIYDELNTLIKGVKGKKINSLYIAYEPIWAIGTGITPSNFEISKVVSYIKNLLKENDVIATVLYGGSVNDENIENLSSIEEVDGFLVGGASNDYKKVIKMCEILMNSTK